MRIIAQPSQRFDAVFSAANDWITLRGVALRDELSDVIQTVREVKGVKGPTNDLEIRSAPGKFFGAAKLKAGQRSAASSVKLAG